MLADFVLFFFCSANRRLANESGRKDFLTNLVEKVKSGEIEKEEMAAHVSTLVLVKYFNVFWQ